MQVGCSSSLWAPSEGKEGGEEEGMEGGEVVEGEVRWSEKTSREGRGDGR